MTFITSQNCSTFIYYFADDANLFCEHKSLQILQNSKNLELINTHTWLCANKLPLRTVPTNSEVFLRGLLNVREKQILTSVIEIQKENWG